MSDPDEIVRDFDGYIPNPTLRSLVGESSPPILLNRTETEDASRALMPGDDPTSHPLHTHPNPYLTKPHSVLMGLLRKGGLPHQEESLIRAALDMQQLQHSDGRPSGAL